MKRQIETKVSYASQGTFVASLGLALLNALAADNSLLGGFPSWLQFILITIIPTLIAFLSGYVKNSTTSTTSDGFNG